jgi:hypothetical protein
VCVCVCVCVCVSAYGGGGAQAEALEELNRARLTGAAFDFAAACGTIAARLDREQVYRRA